MFDIINKYYYEKLARRDLSYSITGAAALIITIVFCAPLYAAEDQYGPKSAAQCSQAYAGNKIMDEIFNTRVWNDTKLKAEAGLLYNKIWVRFVAFCGFGDPGSTAYNENLAKALTECRNGSEPRDVQLRLKSSPYFSSQFPALGVDCHRAIEAVAKTFGFDPKYLTAADNDLKNRTHIVAKFEADAGSGNRQSMYLAAVFLFDLDNREQGVPDTQYVLRGLHWFDRLAQSGGEPLIHNYLLDQERKYDIDVTSAISNFRYVYIDQLYAILVKYNYPAAHIRKARSLMSFAAGKGVSMTSPDENLRSALQQLELAKTKASPTQTDEIVALRTEIARARSGPDWAAILAGLARLASMRPSDGGRVDVQPTVPRFDPCAGAKEMVALDDSFAAPVALGGCSPY